MKKWFQKIADTLDMRDRFVFGGLVLLVTGVAQIYPPAAWIVGGAVIMYFGVR